MKRLYAALLLIILSLAMGIYEQADIKTRTNECIQNINRIDKLVHQKKFSQSERLCRKAAAEFGSVTSEIMYSYYNHQELEKISSNLFCMEEYLKHKNDGDYFTYSISTKRMLLAIKGKEPITFQNIL